jgi:hypothetical protein
VRVVTSMNELVSFKKQQPNCFDDDFGAYYKLLNNQTIQLVNDGTFNLPERFKPKMKSYDIWVELGFGLAFVMLLFWLNRRTPLLVRFKKWLLVEDEIPIQNKGKKQNTEGRIMAILKLISPLDKAKQLRIYGGKSSKEEDLNYQAVPKKQEEIDNNKPKSTEYGQNTEGKKNEIREQLVLIEADKKGVENRLVSKPQTPTIIQLQTQIAQLQDALKAEKRKVEKPNLTDFFYMSSPSQEACFSNNGRTANFMARRSFYRFFVFANGEAHFELCNDTSTIKWAFERPHTVILTACEEVEGRSEEPKEIIIRQRGYAIFEEKSDMWHVTEKAKIEYHY